MLRIPLICVFALLSAFNAHAQCTPDPQYTKPGIYPDSATNLPPAYVGTPYAEVITVVIPVDTLVGSFRINIDSIRVTGFVGFPPGFTYICNPSKCSWVGGATGCVLISGTPSPGDEGAYPLKAYIESFAGGVKSPVRDTVTYLRIVVMPPQGFDEAGAPQVRLGQSYPNPAVRIVEIPLSSSFTGKARLSVRNIIGREVYSRIVDVQRGANRIVLDTGALQPGIYLYAIETKGGTVSRTLTVAR